MKLYTVTGSFVNNKTTFTSGIGNFELIILINTTKKEVAQAVKSQQRQQKTASKKPLKQKNNFAFSLFFSYILWYNIYTLVNRS